MTPLLELEHLEVHFPIKAGLIVDRAVGRVHAVDDVTLRLEEGETLGIVGESGCGKTTLIRSLVRLVDPTGGAVRFRGRDVSRDGRRALRPLHQEVQMVFQDPYASLNPRQRVGQIIATALAAHGVPRKQIDGKAGELLKQVGLEAEHVNRFVHECSGGQRQRIGIARALAMEPRVILLDEPVSALDVSIQAQVINLLEELQDRFRLSYVFVAHDLSIVRHVSDRIAVMYLGKLMELAPADELRSRPVHPYTDTLLKAIPVPDPRENRARARTVVRGDPPSPIDPPAGCRFHPRCPHATDICRTVEPPLTDYGGGRIAACHHPRSVRAVDVASATRSPDSPLSAGEELPQPPVHA